MENYIIELISVAGTFIAAYLGSLWALKNVKKEKYFEEKIGGFFITTGK